MELLRSKPGDPGMPVCGVVVTDLISDPGSRFIDVIEDSRVVVTMLKSLEKRLHERVVVADSWPDERHLDSTVCQGMMHRRRGHRCTVVGMDYLHLVGGLVDDSGQERRCGVVIFRGLDGMPDNFAGVQVNDGVQGKGLSCCCPREEGDVPAVHLVRGRGLEHRCSASLRGRGVPATATSRRQRQPSAAGYTVERGQARQVGVGIEVLEVALFNTATVGEPGGDHLTDCADFLDRQGVWLVAVALRDRVGGPTAGMVAVVVGGPGQSDELQGPGL